MRRDNPPSANQLLTDLVGQEIRTVTGQPNRVISVGSEDVTVGTQRSPHGKPVPLDWIQGAIDRLWSDGDVEISVPSVGYRSAFVGAVLLSISGTRATGDSPPRIVWATNGYHSETDR